MQSLITGDDVFAQVLMLKSENRRPVLIVEGPSDSRALTPHLDSSSVTVVVANGRTSVEVAMRLITVLGVDKTAAVIDSDLDRQRCVCDVPLPGVMRTEYHDLDADIYFTPGLAERVIYNLVSGDALPTSAKMSPRPLYELIAIIPELMGWLRLRSAEEGWRLGMADLPFSQFFGSTRLTFDITQAAVIIVRKSENPNIPLDLLDSVIHTRLESTERDWRLCRGHDLAAAVAAASRRWWGVALSADAVAKALRAAFGCAEFMQTKVYEQLAQYGEEWKLNMISCRLPSTLHAPAY